MSSVGIPDNTAIGPDYDEIKDEPNTEKSSEKLQEEKSVELTKLSNNYFTLMPPEDQENISNVTSYFTFHDKFPLHVQSVNQAANYEVYIPSVCLFSV